MEQTRARRTVAEIPAIGEYALGIVVGCSAVGPPLGDQWLFYRVTIVPIYARAGGVVEAMVANLDPILIFARQACAEGAAVEWGIEHRPLPHIAPDAAWADLDPIDDMYVALVALSGVSAQSYPPVAP